MFLQAKTFVQNSVLLVMDLESGQIPRSMGEMLVASTSTCLAIGTAAGDDEEISIILTDELSRPSADPDLELRFEGVVHTSKKELSVCTVTLQALASIKVSNAKARVQVWANDSREPNKLCILVEGVAV